MSLTTVPSETLARIAAHLPHTDRAALSHAHPSLAKQLHPRHNAFWFDLYQARFAPRPTTPPPAYLTDWHFAVTLRDYVDDYYLHTTLPFKNLHPPTPSSRDNPHPPLIASHADELYIATGTAFSAHRRQNHIWRPPIRRNLDAAITALSVSPTGAVALGSANHSVFFYTPATKAFSRPMRGHRGAVTSILHLQQTLISGSADKTIRLRHATTRRGLAVLRGHDAPVRWLAATSPHTFASHAGADGRVKLWDADRAACLSTGRPGGPVAHAAVDDAGVVYAATARSVSVLDPRMGLANTAAVLSLPRGRAWAGAGPICAMALSGNGRLAAAVGGGGVAVWDPRGTWEARGLGWPRRWFESEGRRLRAVMLGSRSVVAGGGAKELLTFSVDGGYQGVVMEDGVRRAAVSCLVDLGEDGFVVGRADGRVDFADVRAAEGGWKMAKWLLEGRDNGAGRFWESSEPGMEDLSLSSDSKS